MNIRIKDICRFGKKSDIKAGEGNTKGKYMFFTSSIDKDKRIDKFDYDEEGIIMGTGGNATLHYYSGKFTVSTDCLVLLPNSSYKCKYLYYFFLHNMRVLEGGFRGAGLKHTSKSYIENIELTKTHSLLEQDKIISVLSNIDNTIVLQNKRLKLLNELTRSLFIEMFGDLVKGKYEIKKLKDISKKISDGIHSKPEYTKTGRPFLSVVNINKGKVNFEDCKYVSEESFQKMIKSTHPEKGDILYTKVGATYGIAAYIDTNVEFCLYVSVCLIKPKHYLINAKFLSIQMNMPFIKYQADNRIKGIGVPDLHLNQIREFDIIVPPLDLQNRFADYVSSIDKSKLAVKKSLEELEILKKSLMQKYFA